MDLPPIDQNQVAIVETVSHYAGDRYSSSLSSLAVPLTDQCLQRVSDEYKLPAFILKALIKVEGGEPGTVRKNNNGSFDIGVMQINSTNWDIFRDMGVSVSELQWNGCVSLAAAGYLLRGHYDHAERSGNLNDWNDFLRVTANYNSATPKYNSLYQKRLIDALNKLSEDSSR